MHVRDSRDITRARRLLRIVFVTLTTAYGLGATLLILLHYFVGERLGLVALLNNFLLLLLLPALPFALASMLLRRWLAALSLIPALLLLGWSYVPFFIPNRAPANTVSEPIQDSIQISLLTYNLDKDAIPYDTASRVAVIRSANADIVTLQEVSSEAVLSLAYELKQQYPYQELFNSVGDITGLGVLSRYPILERDDIDRGALWQRLSIQVKGTRVTLYNVHVMNPLSARGSLWSLHTDDIQYRTLTINTLMRQAAVESDPVIFAGDFNMTDQTDAYKRMLIHLHDAYRETGWGLGFTFPAAEIVPPLARIDYVFHDDRIQDLNARVWPDTGGSDHQPLFVQLAVHPRNPVANASAHNVRPG
jgi:vancomycin resistance protein VanJ